MNRLKHRRQRAADFARRKSQEPSNIFAVPGKDWWEYIPVHPMSDEVEWLKERGIAPSDCTKVDCYWRLGDDVAFLQIRSKTYGNERPGLYARRVRGLPPMLYLDAVVDEERVSRAVVERVMADFGKIHLSRNLFSDRRIGVKSKRVGDS